MDFESVISGKYSKSKKIPEIIKIKCEQIDNQIYNNKLSKDLTIICPYFKKSDNYFFHEFEDQQYISLFNSSLDNITITLTDEEDNTLNIKSGFASFVKVCFKKMPTKNFFNIRINSEKKIQMNSQLTYLMNIT